MSYGPLRSNAELLEFGRVLHTAFAWPDISEPKYVKRWIARVGRGNIRVVRRDGRVAGGLLVYRLGQWFGGRSVPMAGIAAVGVAPHQRSRGVATELVRRALAELREPLSVLFPATQPVYRRCGFEQAGTYVGYALPTDSIDARERKLDVRPGKDATIRRIYEKQARTTSGVLDRCEALWLRILKPFKGAAHAYVIGRDEGYVVYDQQMLEGSGHYDLLVRDMAVLTRAAGRRLLAFFADHRSLGDSVRFAAGPSLPFFLHPDEQKAKVTRLLRWMLRIVDVKRAIEARGYPPCVTSTAHLDVRDDVLPLNHGRFVIEVADGHARVRRGGKGSIRIDVRGLAAIYTGYLSPLDLRATGYVDAGDRELRCLAPVFAGPAPWMPEIF